jgi:hypothetical protein
MCYNYVVFIRLDLLKILEWQFKVELKNTSLHSLKIVVQNTYIKIIDTLIILITIT